MLTELHLSWMRPTVPTFCRGRSSPVGASGRGRFGYPRRSQDYGCLHADGVRARREIDSERFPPHSGLEEALRAVQTTSPSYILMASLEQAIEMMERNDGAWIDSGVRTAAELTRRLSRFPGSVVGYEEGVPVPPGLMHDPGRVLINLNGLRCTGPSGGQVFGQRAQGGSGDDRAEEPTSDLDGRRRREDHRRGGSRV